MNQPPSSNSSNSSGNNSNRRRRKKPSGGNKGPRPGAQANSSAQSASPTKKSGNRSRRGGRNRRPKSGGASNGPTLHGIDLVRAKYLNLVERHVEARRKYYDLFHRADPNQLRKLEREFTDSQAQVLAFEDSLKPEDREMLHKDYGGKPEDRAYTSNHNLSPEQTEVPTVGDFEDPHVLESQKASNFKDDTEESVGTIDDYKKLKGLI
tara:strand:- start:74635 stop:75258 length:624 start_codon:yes stop_codon:yes gene_type:complete